MTVPWSPAEPAGHRPSRVAVADVHYLPGDRARAAVVVCRDAWLAEVVATSTVLVAGVAPYVPGELYARELPPVTAVLATVARPDLLVVDGYVDLDPQGRPGLGRYAHEQLKVPVVGVAKTEFRGASHAVEVVRGSSRRPLYVTAAGLDTGWAAELVASMAGPHRLPDALRLADALARDRGRGRGRGRPGEPGLGPGSALR